MKTCHLERSESDTMSIISHLDGSFRPPSCSSVPKHLDTKCLTFSGTGAFYSGSIATAITKGSHDKVSYYPAWLQPPL